MGFFFATMYKKSMRKEDKNLKIRGARTNNLKSVNVDIPLNKITCLGGPSGSGKTSLAFHTINNESRRRFLNSFPNNVKFFADKPAPVDVDEIFPVLPVFSLPQINPVIGSRAVVADTMGLTELTSHLYSKYSLEVCPIHQTPLVQESFENLISKKLKLKTEEKIFFYLKKIDYEEVFGSGIFPSRVWDNEQKKDILFESKFEVWELLRVKFPKLKKLNDLFESYPLLKEKTLMVRVENGDFKKISLKSKKTCPSCDFQSDGKTFPSAFSPYNALGACRECNGYGATLEYDIEKLVDKDLSVNDGAISFLNYKPFSHFLSDLKKSMKKKKYSLDKEINELGKEFTDFLYKGDKDFVGFNSLFKYLDRKKYKRNVRIYMRKIQKEELCSVCKGSRLKPEIYSRVLKINNDKILKLGDLYKLTINQLKSYLENFLTYKDNYQKQIVSKLQGTLEIAQEIGLGNLSLMRKTKSLSSGEYQRLLLLKYLSFEGTNALFIFDEPSIGLSNKEQKQLLFGFKKICDQGNTIIIIDHSSFLQQKSDQLILMGPQAGKFGGEIVFQGKPSSFFQTQKTPKLSRQKIKSKKDILKIDKIKIRDFEFKKIEVPLERITWVHGEAGSGKSSCFVQGLANYLSHRLTGQKIGDEFPEVKGVKLPSKLEDVKVIESNLNRYSSRSTVGSSTELFSIVRKHFLNTPYAKALGLKDGHLSANSELGQCSACEGRGIKIIEMQYLEDIVLECEDCKGKKLKPRYASLSDGNLSVSEAYSMPLHELLPKIRLTPKFQRIWEYIQILKLDYLSLDRTVNSLSGGEKQRIYLLSCLVKNLKNTILFFENLSFGLSENDLVGICDFLQNLLSTGNSIVVLDSNPLFSQICHGEFRFHSYGHFESITH